MEKNLTPILLDAFRNKTKLQIITLLLKNGPMTVTQISRLTRTTRSNLYLSMKELLKDDIVVLHETKVVKNYVEKFYSLNIHLFESVKSADVFSEIKKMKSQELRELIASFLYTNSMLSSIMAEEINMMNDEEIEILRRMGARNLLIMSISTLSDETMEKFSSIYRKFFEDMEKSSSTGNERSILVVYSFPMFSNLTVMNSNHWIVE